MAYKSDNFLPITLEDFDSLEAVSILISSPKLSNLEINTIYAPREETTTIDLTFASRQIAIIADVKFGPTLESNHHMILRVQRSREFT